MTTPRSNWRQIAWNCGFVLLGSALTIAVLKCS